MKGRFLALAILLPFLAFSQMPYKQVTVAGVQQVVNLESVYSVIPSTTGKALLRMSGGSILQTDDDYLTFVQMNCATFIEVHATNWEYPTGYSTIGIGSKWVKDIKANGSGAFVTLKEPKNSYYTTESVSYFEPEYLAKICGGGGGGGGAQEFTHNQVAHGFVEGDLIYFSSGTTAKKAQSDVGLADSIAQWVVNDVVNADEFHYCNNCEVTKVTGYTPGSYLWLSTTPGQFTNVQPTLTNCQYVGVVRTANSVYMHIGDICGQSAPSAGADGNGIYDGSGTVPANMVAENANTSRATFQAQTPSGDDGFSLVATDGTNTTYVTSYDDTEPFSVIANNTGTGFFIDGYTGGILQIASGQTMRVTDGNAVQFGLQYSADYSANLKNNARSIPDVGTVNTILTTLVPSMTAGSVVFSNGTTLAQDNANFFWNNTSKRLGIGTNSPLGILDANHDTDQSIYLGRGVIYSAITDYLYLAHYDNGNATDYALRQSQSGITYINTKSAGAIGFSVANVLKAQLSSNGIFIIDPLNAPSTAKLNIGDVVLSGSGSLAGGVLDMTQTWNTSGSPTAIKLNVTDAASNASSLLMDLQVGGVSKLSIRKDGLIVAAGSIATAATFNFTWSTRSTMTSPTDGNIRLSNNSQTDFGLLQFGGTTSSFPALKKSGTGLIARLADDSGYAPFTCQYLYSNSYIQAITSILVGANLTFTSKSIMSSPSDGIIALYNNATDNFSRLQFGGTTSSFPSIKRNSSALDIRLADDSGYAGLSASYLNLDKTITAAGTTGNQTINKATGSVNFAAAATSLTVTNSLVTANSVIICTVATNDTTMKSVAVRASAGSFVMYADAAPTAETQVNFIITN